MLNEQLEDLGRLSRDARVILTIVAANRGLKSLASGQAVYTATLAYAPVTYSNP